MASVQPVKVDSKGVGSYKITVSAGFDGAGKRKRIYKTIEAKSEAAAKKQANLLEAEIVKGDYLEPTNYTFAGYVEAWRRDAERLLAPKTFFRYNQMLNGRILNALGNIKLEKLNSLMIEGFYNDLRESTTLSEQTLRHHHRLISAICATAYKRGLIRENPCSRVSAPVPAKEELIIYDEEQISTLIDALEDAELRFKVCVHIALSAGLRLGEIMGLEWPDVNFDNSTITVCRASQYLPGKGTFTKSPKNESSKRIVSLPGPVMEFIKQLQREQKVQKLRLANKWENSNRLFTNVTGGIPNPYSVSTWFSSFLKEKGLPPLCFHGLRHTSASYLISRGVDAVTVAKRLGHSNASTTLRVYAHAFRKRDEEAANKMAGLYFIKGQASKAN